MESGRGAKAKLLVFALLLLAVVAVVNLMGNVLRLSEAGASEGGTIPFSLPRPVVAVDPESTLLFGTVISLAGLAILIGAYVRYRPRLRLPVEELLPIAVGILFLLSLALILTPNEGALDAGGADEQGGAEEPAGETTTGTDTGGIALTFNLGPRSLGLLLAATLLLATYLFLGASRRRRDRAAGEAPTPEERQAAIRTLEEGIYHLQLGRDTRSVILECYKDLLHLFHRRGVRAPAAATAREVERLAKASLGLSFASATALRDLFEVARYSVHPLTKADRRSAMRYLGAAREELEATHRVG